MKNYGINLEKEKLELSEKDRKFGGQQNPEPIAIIPENLIEQFLPKGEVQKGKEDTMDCVARAINNNVESQLNYLLKIKQLPDENWFRDKGYITENGFELSDAFLAILSGTTKEGNSLKAPLDTIRKLGAIPKRMLPLESWMTFDDYMNPDRITPSMRALGLQFLDRLQINYEQVSESDFDKCAEPIVTCLYAWTLPINGEYPKSTLPFNHCIMKFKNRIIRHYVFDNYIDIVDGDFIKKLAQDYLFYNYGYRIILSKSVKKEETLNFIEKMIKFIAEQLGFIQKQVDELPKKEYKPLTEVIPTPLMEKYKWDTKENIRHSIRLICDKEGLTVQEKNELCATIQGESGFNLQAKNENKINGKVVSTDWGLCQINDYYHIGQGKSFPSVDFVLNNPEKVVRWMCKQWKLGNKNWWIAFKNGSYKKFL